MFTIECSRTKELKNGNSKPSIFVWRVRSSAECRALTKLEGKPLPFLNPILLKHSIADKSAALLGRDCIFYGIRQFWSFSPFSDLNHTLKSGSTWQLTVGFPKGRSTGHGISQRPQIGQNKFPKVLFYYICRMTREMLKLLRDGRRKSSFARKIIFFSQNILLIRKYPIITYVDVFFVT